MRKVNPFDRIKEPIFRGSVHYTIVAERFIPDFYCAVYSGAQVKPPCVKQCRDCIVRVKATQDKNKKLPPLKNP